MSELPTFSRVPANPKAYARDALQFAGPDLESLCAALGIHPRPADFEVDALGSKALLVPDPKGGFVALVASSVVRGDPAGARLCVAHEAARALFYDRSKAPPEHVALWPPTPAEEEFCHDFAAELLALEHAPTDRLWPQENTMLKVWREDRGESSAEEFKTCDPELTACRFADEDVDAAADYWRIEPPVIVVEDQNGARTRWSIEAVTDHVATELTEDEDPP